MTNDHDVLHRLRRNAETLGANIHQLTPSPEREDAASKLAELQALIERVPVVPLPALPSGAVDDPGSRFA